MFKYVYWKFVILKKLNEIDLQQIFGKFKMAF